MPRRATATALTALIAATLLPLTTTGSASAAPSAAPEQARTVTATSAVYKDPKHDVSKQLGAIRKRKADLDLRKVTAKWTGTQVVLTVKVADLKPGQLAYAGDGITQVIPVSAVMHFGKNLYWTIYWNRRNDNGPGGAADLVKGPDTFTDDPEYTCVTSDGYTSRMTQAANFERNTVRFTIPVDCLPAGHSTARVNGHTLWRNKKGVDMWDDAYNRGYGKPADKSKPFRFR